MSAPLDTESLGRYVTAVASVSAVYVVVQENRSGGVSSTPLRGALNSVLHEKVHLVRILWQEDPGLTRSEKEREKQYLLLCQVS